MRDISWQLRQAAEYKQGVDEALSRKVADALGERLDWEWGEDWASIGDDAVVAYVYVRAPLVISVKAKTAAVVGVADGAVVIEMTDRDAVELSADADALRSLFGRDFSDDPDLNPSGFAASDLWFCTI